MNDVQPKYDTTVTLTGEDGNAFNILGKVRNALRQAGASSQEMDEFFDEATAGNYEHLLHTVARWVHVQ